MGGGVMGEGCEKKTFDFECIWLSMDLENKEDDALFSLSLASSILVTALTLKEFYKVNTSSNNSASSKRKLVSFSSFIVALFTNKCTVIPRFNTIDAHHNKQ